MQTEKTLSFTVDDIESGDRLDVYLTQKKDGSSRSFFQRLIDDGNVTVNGKTIKKPAYKISTGELITVELPEPVSIDVEPENIPLDFVYQDDDLAVINKPQGMVVHPAPGNYSGTLVNALLYHCKDLSGINSVLRPGIVHRLDKDTSGLIVIAKNDIAHVSLAEQIKQKSAHRTYLALVDGAFNVEGGTLETGYGRNPDDRLKMMAFPLQRTQTDPNLRVAKTDYKVLEQFCYQGNNYSLVQCDLHTGRTHQIRVHMAYIRHPVVGDAVYGKQPHRFKLNGQLLHAARLSFCHPKTGEQMTFEAELPDYFQRVLTILRQNSR
ncbi:MAG: RluA family pseudouridine synthase [Clostridiales bacterium]|nr:RluA family pseudouridine synthase [Clostridiales bacterium]